MRASPARWVCRSRRTTTSARRTCWAPSRRTASAFRPGRARRAVRGGLGGRARRRDDASVRSTSPTRSRSGCSRSAAVRRARSPTRSPARRRRGSSAAPPTRTCCATAIDTRIVGTPDEVAAGLATLQRVTGADELLVTTETHDPRDRVRSFELLAEAWGLRRRRPVGTPTRLRRPRPGALGRLTPHHEKEPHRARRLPRHRHHQQRLGDAGPHHGAVRPALPRADRPRPRGQRLDPCAVRVRLQRPGAVGARRPRRRAPRLDRAAARAPPERLVPDVRRQVVRDARPALRRAPVGALHHRRQRPRAAARGGHAHQGPAVRAHPGVHPDRQAGLDQHRAVRPRRRVLPVPRLRPRRQGGRRPLADDLVRRVLGRRVPGRCRGGGHLRRVGRAAGPDRRADRADPSGGRCGRPDHAAAHPRGVPADHRADRGARPGRRRTGSSARSRPARRPPVAC